MKTETPMFGVTRFTYCIEEVTRIKELLLCNNGDIVKVFQITYEESRVDDPVNLLYLIDRVKNKGDEMLSETHDTWIQTRLT